MSARWRLRPAREAELERIVEVARAEIEATGGVTDLDATSVRQQTAADPHFEWGRDAVVAELDGEVIGVAMVDPPGVRILVVPEREEDALRGELLDWAEHRQREAGRRALRIYAESGHVGACGLLERRGYTVERFYARMVIDVATGSGPQPIPAPAGYGVRPMDRDRDADALHALDELAFSVLPDYEPEDLAEFVGRHLSPSAFAPEWSLCVDAADGTLAGSLIGFRRPRPAGWVAVLAVHPDHQRRGLARCLLSAAFAAIRGAGLDTAELGVASDNPRGLELYASMGMVPRARMNVYRHEL